MGGFLWDQPRAVSVLYMACFSQCYPFVASNVKAYSNLLKINIREYSSFDVHDIFSRDSVPILRRL